MKAYKDSVLCEGAIQVNDVIHPHRGGNILACVKAHFETTAHYVTTRAFCNKISAHFVTTRIS